ncbi:replication-relaxation family protein [Actinokineospora sp. PR83]|uniref:replication-relaxation family protein n=1 Tax=Actinokineospora sp. PR83 TaxID=2884908 RepID=UPI001F25A327|nr:replication-relaxation family protein [Actinokineospora sp. PR83]MCG8914914.1 replication-relaxation family protein [Actinokineospora sp. PR83]
MTTRRPRPTFTNDRLSDRDWAVLLDLYRLRVMAADQIERVHFAGLTGRSREVVRGRVLRRLVNWRLITSLGRRIGGTRRGSGSTAYALDSTGLRLLGERLGTTNPTVRIRRPRPPGGRFLEHGLAVSALYADLMAATRDSEINLGTFAGEPDSWWPDGAGGQLKPDAYARLARGNVIDHWWIEVDRATESLPTIRRKLTAYLSFAERGQLGPNGVVPRVLVSTISEQRQQVIRAVVRQLPTPADELFLVTLDRDAWLSMLSSLKT